MRKSKIRTCLLLAICAVLSTVIGCNLLAWPLYAVSPATNTKTVKAQYAGLAGKTVALVIVADESMLSEYKNFRIQLSWVIAAEMEKHLPDIRIVSPIRIVRFQDANLDWRSMGRARLGRKFSSDYVLDITLLDYGLREPGSASLYRGRIKAAVELFKTTEAPAQACVWRESEIGVSYPKGNRPVTRISGGVHGLRLKTEQHFATALVNRFHDYKVKAPR